MIWFLWKYTFGGDWFILYSFIQNELIKIIYDANLMYIWILKFNIRDKKIIYFSRRLIYFHHYDSFPATVCITCWFLSLDILLVEWVTCWASSSWGLIILQEFKKPLSKDSEDWVSFSLSIYFRVWLIYGLSCFL